MNVKRLDPREAPAYTISEVAGYLRLPTSTLRWWSRGRDSYRPLITPAGRDGRTVLLSFLNLVELHVLSVIRREHEIHLTKVRRAIDFLERRLQINAHPLLDRQMLTDGADIFVEELGRLINVTQYGQVEIRDVLSAALKRIDRDPAGVPIRLYPFTRRHGPIAADPNCEPPRLVMIDARIAGGRPVLTGTGIAIDVIVDRYLAGESTRELAEDYERPEEEIEEALRCAISEAA